MKKILSIILISLLALGLVACGDTSQNKTPGCILPIRKKIRETE